jgi:hypothetical protein
LCRMKFFRKSHIAKLLLILAGVTFLNMSFIPAEVAFFGIDNDSALIENLAKYGVEEEKEGGGEKNEGDDSTKEIDLSITPFAERFITFILKPFSHNGDFVNLVINAGFKETFFTPPDRA